MKTLSLEQMENVQGGQAAKEIGRFVACGIAGAMMAMTLGPIAAIGMEAVCSLGHLL